MKMKSLSKRLARTVASLAVVGTFALGASLSPMGVVAPDSGLVNVVAAAPHVKGDPAGQTWYDVNTLNKSRTIKVRGNFRTKADAYLTFKNVGKETASVGISNLVSHGYVYKNNKVWAHSCSIPSKYKHMEGTIKGNTGYILPPGASVTYRLKPFNSENSWGLCSLGKVSRETKLEITIRGANKGGSAILISN